MAQSALEAAQGACVKIGANKIAALNGTDKVSVALNDRIDILKRNLLRMHPWNFAIKRTVLEPTWYAISNAVTNGGLIRITSATHPFATNDRVTISGVTGVPANGQWFITVSSTTVFDLQDSTFSGTYEASSTDQVAKAAQFGYDYEITLPSDNLRTLRVNESCPVDYRIEKGKLLIDLDEVEFKYIYDVTDYTTMSIDFYEALHWYLALDVCYLITQSSQLKEMLQENFRRALAKARFDDATEDPAEQVGADDWLLSRENGSDSWLSVGRY
jgi:hypothetical protein